MHEALLVIVGFVVAFIGTMSGGGAGLIALFVLLAFGMPINQAIATNKLGDMGFFFPALRNLSKAKQVKKKALPPIILINVTGGAIGTFAIAKLNTDMLSKLVAVILILIIISSILHKNYATKERSAKPYWPLAYFATTMSSGAVGAGTGILNTMVLMNLRGFTALQAMANSFYASLFGWTMSLGILLFTDLINYRFAFFLFIGNLVGAHFGSKIAIKKGNGFVRIVTILLAITVAVRLLLF